MHAGFSDRVYLALLVAGGILILAGGCRKKDPDFMKPGSWESRSLQCASETLVDLEKRLLDRAQEADRLMKELQKHLEDNQCPGGKHPQCVPGAGIQAIATLISGARIPGDETPYEEPESLPDEGDDLGEIGSLDVEAASKAKSVRRKSRLFKEEMGDDVKETRKETLPGTGPASETEPGPKEIAGKAGCGVEVTDKCSFLVQDTVISRLTIFLEQAAQLELEAHRYLESTGQRLNEQPVQNLFAGMRTLEGQIHELVTREELAMRRKGADEAFFQTMHPLVIKGIVSDLSVAVPAKLIEDLKKLVPMVNRGHGFFQRHETEWRQKVAAAIRHLHKSQRVHANVCLQRPNCWQFRQCVKRYQLPGILMLD